MGVRDVIVLGFFLPSLPICFFRPFYGILLWTIVSFVNPQQLAYGPAAFFPLALVVAIPTLAGALVFGRGWRHLKSREVLLLVVLWIWFTITSAVAGNTPMFAAHLADTWYRWQFVSKIFLMTITTICVVDSFDRLRIFLLVIAACLGVFVLKDLPFMIATGGSFRLYGPPQSMIADNNDFGLALNMTLPLFFFLGKTEPNGRIRMFMYFMALITVPAIFFTYSRGALLGLGVVAMILFLRVKKRILLLPVLGLATLAAVVLAPASWQDRMSFFLNGKLDASALSRFNSWTFSWRLASDFPIMGGGFETFTPELFQRYATTATDVHGPHSVYFGVLAEHGFPGLILYLLLVLSCLASLQRVIRSARFRGDQRAIDYADMLRLSIVAFLVSGVFLGRAYFDFYFSIVACVAILSHVCREAWAENDAVEFDESAEDGDSMDVPALGMQGILR